MRVVPADGLTDREKAMEDVDSKSGEMLALGVAESETEIAGEVEGGPLEVEITVREAVFVAREVTLVE